MAIGSQAGWAKATAGHRHKNGFCNYVLMNTHHLQSYCELDAAGRDLLRRAFSRLRLSARAYDRILKVARTIADLDEEQKIQAKRLAEAIAALDVAVLMSQSAVKGAKLLTVCEP
ncbi:MAG: hypothetical protein M1571_06440 [Firmicutes bacterium]|nr:hypothetical protein [Bacillota bacterium]